MSAVRVVKIRRHRDQRATERELLGRAISASPELRRAWIRLYEAVRAERDPALATKGRPS